MAMAVEAEHEEKLTAIDAEQEEKLSMLMAFAGDAVDIELAKVMLESAGWDVERALNGLLEEKVPTTSSEAMPTIPTMATPDSSRAAMAEGQADELSTEDLRALLDAYDVDHSMCLEKADLVNLLERTVGHHGGEQTAPAPELNFPMEPDTQFFTDMYSLPSTRASSARSEDFPESWTHRLTVICGKYPSAPRPQVIALLKKHDGAACLVEHELQEIIRVKEEQAKQNAERKAEIEMQNQEYYESLLMDQHQESQRKEIEAAERKQAEERKRKQAEEAEANREAEIAFETKKSRVEQPEPDNTHPDRCQIVIRTPSGKRLSRTFLGSDDVSFIYDWIDVACAEESFVKEKYQLVARLPGKPNKELCKSQQTLKGEGVEHQSVFMISCS